MCESRCSSKEAHGNGPLAKTRIRAYFSAVKIIRNRPRPVLVSVARWNAAMTRPKSPHAKLQPSREHWWWRDRRLTQALDDNGKLAHFFYWKEKGRPSPDGKKWTPVQRRGIETALWLYEFDARISHKYLLAKPAHLLGSEQLSSLIALTYPMEAQERTSQTGARRRPFEWSWIEYFDMRSERKARRLRPAELDGMIAAMKFCMEYFLRG
jgi:hypothetical protein